MGRLLYALDPAGDPRGALQYLEYLSLRARRYNLLETLASARPDETPLPGLAYSLALGKALAPGGPVPSGGPADEALLQAVLMYPVVVARLMARLRVRLCVLGAGRCAMLPHRTKGLGGTPTGTACLRIRCSQQRAPMRR